VQAERNDPAYERERIDELTVFIEGNLLDELDELDDLGGVEGFCLNAKAGLERGIPQVRGVQENVVYRSSQAGGTSTTTNLQA
jgi:hypothetical protein